MKKALLSLILAITSLTVMAQCFTPPTGSPGFHPESDNIPCIDKNMPYSTALSFQNFDSATLNGVIFRVNYLIIDSIINLPCGISWSTNYNDTLINQENGCIFFSGTTADLVGQYPLFIKARISSTLFPGSLLPFDLASLGLRVDLRVRDNSTSVCPAIDTVTGNNYQAASCNTGYVNTTLNIVSGKVYVDTDGNGSFNGNDYPLAGYRVNAGSTYAITNPNGNYFFSFTTGTHNVALATDTNYSLSSNPAQYPFNFTTVGNDYPGNDFGLNVENTVNDLSITVNNSFFRPGFAGNYWLTVKNLGTVVASSTVHLDFDTLFTVTGTVPTALSQTPGQASWAVNNLLPGQTQNYTLSVTTPIDVTLLGDTVVAYAYLDSTVADTDTENNTFTNTTIISGAYDPNDKTPYPAELTEAFVDGNSYITYRIRFQNTGNDTAFNIVVRDTINSPHLDVNTVQMLSASHEYTFQMQGNVAIWTFNNILLPDSNVNEPGSHGHIFFRLKIKNTNIHHGTEIMNQAGIYFDFNPVVMTDPSIAKADFSIGIREVAYTQGQVFVYPNPITCSSFTIEHKSWTAGSTVQLVDMAGKLIANQPLTGARTEVSTVNLPNGIYLYRVSGANGVEGMGKVVVAR